MLDVPRSDEIPQSKRKDLILTASIVSLFFMHNDGVAQNKTQLKDRPNINYIEAPQNPYLLFTPRNVDTEYPNRDIFLQTLMDSLKPHQETIEKTEAKPQVLPLSFAKKNINKYFPERSDCFAEIISKIQQNPQLTREINKIISQTILKPTIVNKENIRRPSSERDKICGIMCFLEGTMKQNKFASYIDQKDKLAILSCEPNNRQVSDTLKYETRLAIADQWIMPGEMMQRVLEADSLFKKSLVPQTLDNVVASK